VEFPPFRSGSYTPQKLTHTTALDLVDFLLETGMGNMSRLTLQKPAC